jgi:hypothetical protein
MANETKLFKSTDSGAPVLSGSAGALLSVLDACLINGYNSKAVQGITRSGAVATLTYASAHNYLVNDIITVAGADQAEYNGVFRVVSTPTTTSLTVAVTGTPATPATTSTSLSSLKSPVGGWTKAFTGTNLGAYKSTDGLATGMYINVDDTTGTGKYATINGFEAMTAISTGTGNFGTQYFHKSSTADATARPWMVIADSRMVFLLIGWNQAAPPSSTTQYDCFCFGDVNSYVTGDAYHYLLKGCTVTNPAGIGAGSNMSAAAVTNGTQAPARFARSYAQIAPVDSYQFSAAGARSSSGAGNADMWSGNTRGGGGVYPNHMYALNPSDLGLHFCTVYVCDWISADTKYSIRGTYPGLQHIMEMGVIDLGSSESLLMSGVAGIDNGLLLAVRSQYNSSYGTAFLAFSLGNWR